MKSQCYQRKLVQATSIDIERKFGPAFIQNLEQAPVNQWHGPIDSAYGKHFVYVYEKQASATEPYDKVKDKVLKDWQYQQSKKFRQSFEKQLLDKYQANIESPVTASITAMRSYPAHVCLLCNSMCMPVLADDLRPASLNIMARDASTLDITYGKCRVRNGQRQNLAVILDDQTVLLLEPKQIQSANGVYTESWISAARTWTQWTGNIYSGITRCQGGCAGKTGR